MSDAPLSDAQFSELLRVIRETVRAEVSAELAARRPTNFSGIVRDAGPNRPGSIVWLSEGMVI